LIPLAARFFAEFTVSLFAEPALRFFARRAGSE
jgi:hypothetical protein